MMHWRIVVEIVTWSITLISVMIILAIIIHIKCKQRKKTNDRHLEEKPNTPQLDLNDSEVAGLYDAGDTEIIPQLDIENEVDSSFIFIEKLDWNYDFDNTNDNAQNEVDSSSRVSISTRPSVLSLGSALLAGEPLFNSSFLERTSVDDDNISWKLFENDGVDQSPKNSSTSMKQEHSEKAQWTSFYSLYNMEEVDLDSSSLSGDHDIPKNINFTTNEESAEVNNGKINQTA